MSDLDADPCRGCPVSMPSPRGNGEECWRCMGIGTEWRLPVQPFVGQSEDIPFCPALETMQKAYWAEKENLVAECDFPKRQER